MWGSLRSPNYTLHTEHAYCLSYRFLNNVVITTVIEMVEMVEKLDGRLGKRSVERVGYVINNLLHFVIVKYGDNSLVLFISTRLRLVLHADLCNKSYIYVNLDLDDEGGGSRFARPITKIQVFLVRPDNIPRWTHNCLNIYYPSRSSEARPPPNHLGLDFHIKYIYVRRTYVRF